MPPGVGAVATRVALATPAKGRRMPIPALDGLGEPPLERLGVGGVLTGKCSPLDDALQRLGHVEPGPGGRRLVQEDGVLRTPLHQRVALMSCQIV